MAEPLKIALDLTQPQIKSLLTQLQPHIILYDFVQHWIPQISSELRIKSVHFCVYSAASISFFTSGRLSTADAPTLEEMKSPPKDHPLVSSLRIKTFEARSLLYIYTIFDDGPSPGDRIRMALEGGNAVLYKSCIEMEKIYIEYLRAQNTGKPVLLAGPALPTPDLTPKPNSRTGLDLSFAEFLDRFPPKTVVFCSFGSESFLDTDQIHELALGLELTGLPFFLVLNLANQPAGKELDDDVGRAVREALPSGFLERVKGQGMVTSGWVPQKEILSHESVGCYVCHCGFSSVVEAIVADCQLVLVSLKGDQFMNSKLLSLDMEVGVEVNRRDEDGWFGKLDVYEAIKKVVVDVDREPGRTVRKNHVKWRDFLMRKDVHEGYVDRLVEDLEKLVWVDDNHN